MGSVEGAGSKEVVEEAEEEGVDTDSEAVEVIVGMSVAVIVGTLTSVGDTAWAMALRGENTAAMQMAARTLRENMLKTVIIIFFCRKGNGKMQAVHL